MANSGKLILKDGTYYEGLSFGYPKSSSGEVVFNTGLVGYPESLTDPSYKGQILVLTYPLVGNYGVPPSKKENGLLKYFESEKIQIAGLIVSEYVKDFSHHQAEKSLGAWLKKQRRPALAGIDTRSLTQKLRLYGTLLGKIIINHQETNYYDPNAVNLMPLVSIKKPKTYGQGARKIVLIDCGLKNNILRELIKRKVQVRRVPWNFPLARARFKFDGVVISNGPGNPIQARETISEIKGLMEKNIPVLGICLGNQLLALAAGAKTYKLKFGHRSQNQPCQEVGTKRCFITSQNHGFAVDKKTLGRGFLPWFKNLNDQTLEGIKHKVRPFLAVQFHPEASPGPDDTSFIFDYFLRKVKKYAKR